MEDCTFCKNDGEMHWITRDNNIAFGMGKMDLIGSGWTFDIADENPDSYEIIHIHYCPFCGRNLDNDIKF